MISRKDKFAGIDIGTTTICCVVIDGPTGEAITAISHPNDSFIPTSAFWERIQKPDKIIQIVQELLEGVKKQFPDIAGIAVTGQMHGVLYVDESGDAVSPLFTWQDGRGNLQEDGMTFAKKLSELTGYRLATGFGWVTHYFNQNHGLIPDAARRLCTIQDYAVMKLSSTSIPLMDLTNAESLGCFNFNTLDFDFDALRRAEVDVSFAPEIIRSVEPVGVTRDRVAVFPALGDNQASFIGSVRDKETSVLLNIGTGSQVSVFSEEFVFTPGIEVRPYPGGGYLLAGSPLCGGRAYTLLRDFFEMTVKLFSHAPRVTNPADFYSIMNTAAIDAIHTGNRLAVDTRFSGTRHEPEIRGRISNIDIGNFTPENLTAGFITGIVMELYNLFRLLPESYREKIRVIVGSGNGLRNNPAMQAAVKNIFQLELKLPLFSEEAAYGAALMALAGAGRHSSLDNISQFIRYI
ncbi:MAG: FGGY family carbohydrate kinase [Spirochaetota bacterium]